MAGHTHTHQGHNHQAPQSGQRFFAVTVLNVLITVFELVGGLLSGSLALVSDAFHNLSDAIAIVISYVANRIAKKTPTETKTFGFARAEILAAFLNAGFLVIIAIVLTAEAITHILHPEEVNGGVMLIVAVISLVANAGSTLLLNAGAKHNLNMKATYLHLLGDALASLGVLIGAVVITLWKLYWVDPVLTILASLYIAWEAWPIVKKTVAILMQGSPDLDYAAIERDVTAIPGVLAIHHFHAWSVDEHHLMVSLHVNMEDQPLSKVEVSYHKIERILHDKYHISHVTIQAECNRGLNEKMFYDCKDRNDC